MLKHKTGFCLLLALVFAFCGCGASTHRERLHSPMSEPVLQTAQGMKSLAGVEADECLLNKTDSFPAGTSVCDWAV